MNVLQEKNLLFYGFFLYLQNIHTLFSSYIFCFLFTAKCGKTSLLVILKGTLRSDTGDVHENVAEKQTSHYFKIFRRLSQLALLLKRRGFWLELKRGERAQVRTEMVEFIALPFPFPSKLKIWSFHVVVVQWRQRNVQKSVMHVQSCCFAH